MFYPWRFGNHFAVKNLKCELQYVSQRTGKERFYDNLVSCNLEPPELGKVHTLALNGKEGWSYTYRRGGQTQTTAKILYELLIGERPVFKLKTGAVVSKELSRILELEEQMQALSLNNVKPRSEFAHVNNCLVETYLNPYPNSDSE